MTVVCLATICFKQHPYHFYYIKKDPQKPVTLTSPHCNRNLALVQKSFRVTISVKNTLDPDQLDYSHLLQGLFTVVTGGHGLKNPTALKTLLSVSRHYHVPFPVSPQLLGTCGKCSEIFNSSCLTKKPVKINCTDPDQTASEKAV